MDLVTGWSRFFCFGTSIQFTEETCCDTKKKIGIFEEDQGPRQVPGKHGSLTFDSYRVVIRLGYEDPMHVHKPFCIAIFGF